MDSTDQFILDVTTRKPRRVWDEGTTYLRNVVWPTL